VRTRITELFGVEHPIIQGGLMWIATAELTSAVANAGAMGFMTALTYETPEGLRDEIRKCRDLTDKPFGVNLTFLPSLRQPDYPAYLHVCAEEGIQFIETAGRNPEPYMPALKAAGMKVIHKCTSVRHARKAQTIGCDAVSIDGFECAGHPGEDDVTSLVLLPATADALDIPIVASGGFGDGRGLVAALALGADGMNMGTRFVATEETPLHPAVKQALLDHDETDTTLIMRTLRNTERVLDNETARKVIEIESTGTATIQDLIPYVSGRRGLDEVVLKGNVEEGTLAVGQVIGLIHDIPTVADLIERIMTEAEDLISRGLPGLMR
jgi:NAD(P)H-dependent flavin oxidoreductase YrpB (nitropropane dioxygenase family)